MKIIFVAGHGKGFLFNDDGARAKDGTTEREIVLKVIDELAKLKNPDFIFVGYQRMTLTEKIRQVNKICKKNGLNSQNSILVSLHTNSAHHLAQGAEAWHYARSRDSKKLGQAIVDSISHKLNIRNRGSKDEYNNRHGRLGIIHDTIPLAVLIELGFISNQYDLATLKTKPNIIALAIIKGIENYLGHSITKKKKSSNIAKYAFRIKHDAKILMESKKLESFKVELEDLIKLTNDIIKKL